MKAVMLMFDSLNRHLLEPYGCEWTKTPNFRRLAERTLVFDSCYAGSLPCMPARRELHTGRYNFLHKCWGPLENYDDSMPELLKASGVYTHLSTDHLHYWEDGGGGYVTRYDSWELARGQEGDPWKGEVGAPPPPETVAKFSGYRAKLFRQDQINRGHLTEEKDHPMAKTVEAGIEFLRTNAAEDRWFLHIETFDPHEPFFSYPKYKALYPHGYAGPQFDWPDYKPVTETPDQVAHARFEYAALLSMCDAYLGKVLDEFDRLNLWKDTMLIVNTDHGYLLGEHGFWAKNYMPPYEEIAHTPLFVWDPRSGARGERRSSLVQTIDLPATLLDFFGAPLPQDMQGKPIAPVVEADRPIRDFALFGYHGGYACVTDGKRTLIKSFKDTPEEPLYNYTLIPHGFFMLRPEALGCWTQVPPFPFTKGCPLMRIRAADPMPSPAQAPIPDLLFDLESDPGQASPIRDVDLKAALEAGMRRLMEENDSPREHYRRLGL